MYFRIFSKRGDSMLFGVEYVRSFCKEKNVAISKLESDLGFSNGYLNPKKLTKIPYDRALLIANYLGAELSRILGSEDELPQNSDSTLPYYINDDARDMAQFLFEHPEYKVLFDASRKVSSNDIETVKTILDKFRSND